MAMQTTAVLHKHNINKRTNINGVHNLAPPPRSPFLPTGTLCPHTCWSPRLTREFGSSETPLIERTTQSCVHKEQCAATSTFAPLINDEVVQEGTSSGGKQPQTKRCPRHGYYLVTRAHKCSHLTINNRQNIRAVDATDTAS